MNKELLEILACPKCKGKLDFNDEENKLVCENCRLKFKIEDDIPIMLVEKAEKF